MAVHVALLRAINVGGCNRIVMSDLREMFGELGLAQPRTLLQSGNVVFEGKRRAADSLERLLETETAGRFNVAVDYLIRTAKEWKTIVESNPFRDMAKCDPSHLLLMFLKKPPHAEHVKALQAAIQGPEIVRSRGKELYLAYPAGVGRSTLTTSRIERKLSIRGTARNWNTVLKLAALVET